MSEKLTESEQARAFSCACNILDKAHAIREEAVHKEAYKSYIKEKLVGIECDLNCLKYMCEESENKK